MGVTFYTVDVGHGLCQVIKFGKRAILIDGGGHLGKKVAVDFLTRYIKVIVAYVATHNDSDHTAAAPEILEHYPSRATLHKIFCVLDRPAKRPTDTAEDVMPLLAYARRRDKEKSIETLHVLQVADEAVTPRTLYNDLESGLELQLLYPKPSAIVNAVIRGRPSAIASNQACAILRLIVGDPSAKAAALITGDANCMSFGIAHDEYHFDLSARILCLPHHGGAIPCPAGAPDWPTIVEWVNPEIAVASAGYGTVPASTTTRRGTFDPLRQRHARIACTQLTKHCHPQFDTLHQSSSSMSPWPQMSGHPDYPDAVRCAGTIAIRIERSGAISMFDEPQHQAFVDDRVSPLPGCPHCR